MDKCREAFERHQADLTDTDYEVLKHHFDNNEQYFGSRYNEGSLYERDWFVWEACWQSRQAEFDSMTEALLNQTQLLAKQKAEINQLQSQINEMAEVGLGQEGALREKDKRIERATAKWISIVTILTTTDTGVPDAIFKQLDQLHDALCGMNEIGDNNANY